MIEIRVEVNGRSERLAVEPHWTLLSALRDVAGQTDVKYGCGEGVCGACAVLLDGTAVNACSVLAVQADGLEVTTAAGLTAGEALHPLQAEMVERGAVQCGFCTPGMVIGALEAVSLGAAGAPDEIRHSLAGNICRCTGYRGIVEAVEAYRDAAARAAG